MEVPRLNDLSLEDMGIVLETLLRQLDPIRNFNVFKWEGSIPVSTELAIPHKLGRVPVGYIVIRCKDAMLFQGDTQWTPEIVYLKNNSASEVASGTVLFFL